jgi:glycosyltransferase involved in cell wall biosynthesis
MSSASLGARRPAVVILTYNEEKDVGFALESVAGWAEELWILDSFSTDKTLEVAARYPCKVVQRAFDSFSGQRNHAIRELPIRSEWMLFLDADERASEELKAEIDRVLAADPAETHFRIRRRLMWMGRWLRRGLYPTWIVRLFRRRDARCEDRPVNEHIVVSGKGAELQGDIIHEDRRGLSAWIAKHDSYARKEAAVFLSPAPADFAPSLFGAQAERKRWIRRNVWDRLPLFVRPFLYFAYRYFLRGGLLEGRPALVYHFLQALWFPFLIDCYILEMRERRP